MPSTAPRCCPQAQRDGGGTQGRAADGKQKPLESSAPHGYFLSLPNKQDHKCFLSKATLLQCALLCRGEGCREWDGMADTMERGLGDSGGHCQAAPAPSPSSANTPDPPTSADICGHLCSGRCQPPASQHLPPLPDPAPDTRHKSTKNPSLGRRGPARMVKDQLEPCL